MTRVDMLALQINRGKHQGKQLLIPEQTLVVIGRDPDCQVRISSPGVSRRHCTLRRTGARLLVSDLDSRNGTLVNNIRIRELTVLKVGDLLSVGEFEFNVVERKDTTTGCAAPLDESAGVAEQGLLDWLFDESPPAEETSIDDTAILRRPPTE